MAILIQTNDALAGPGGYIAKAAFKTWWGRLIIAVLVIIFLPLIIYIRTREKIGIRKATKIANELSKVDQNFNWLNQKARFKGAFMQVHSAWSKTDMERASEWMTTWYWRNQQLVHLDRWEEKGLVNVCKVKTVKKMKLLHVQVSNLPALEDSVMIVSIEAEMIDFLKNKKTGKVVEGDQSYKDVETVWTFTLEEGKWLINNIEPGSLSLAYAKLKKVFDMQEVKQLVGGSIIN